MLQMCFYSVAGGLLRRMSCKKRIRIPSTMQTVDITSKGGMWRIIFGRSVKKVFMMQAKKRWIVPLQ